MRLVLDTNVLVSSLITQGSPPDLLYREWDGGAFELVTSRPQLAELARVLRYTKLRPYVTLEEADALLETIAAVAVVLDDVPVVELSKDPDDDMILATAIAGEVDLLVTGDKSDLLRLGSVRGIPIVTPRQALRQIGKEK